MMPYYSLITYKLYKIEKSHIHRSCPSDEPPWWSKLRRETSKLRRNFETSSNHRRGFARLRRVRPTLSIRVRPTSSIGPKITPFGFPIGNTSEFRIFRSEFRSERTRYSDFFRSNRINKNYEAIGIHFVKIVIPRNSVLRTKKLRKNRNSEFGKCN